MGSTGVKPWLLMDIDGVLNPFWGDRKIAERGAARVKVATRVGEFKVVFVPEHGPMLLGMTDDFRLGWATWWMAEANADYRTHLGLPELPVAMFDQRKDGFTKVPGILRLVGDDPFAWIDDDISQWDKTDLAEAHSNHLVIDIDGQVGLESWHLEKARAWAGGLNG